jgi:hypothetical protein
MSSILEEMRQSATGALDKARQSTSGALDKARLVVLNRGSVSERDISVSSENQEGSNSENSDTQQAAEDENSASWSEELSHYCPKLTFQQRLIGFVTSFGMGYLIAFFSFRFFIRLVEGRPMPFVINYTFGMFCFFFLLPGSELSKRAEEQVVYCSKPYTTFHLTQH